MLLTSNGDVASYLFLATLADSFDFNLLQDQSQTNLMNVDLRINYLMTLLTKLQLNNCNDKATNLAHLVACAFYRSISYG